jgi:hypothetical protein
MVLRTTEALSILWMIGTEDAATAAIRPDERVWFQKADGRVDSQQAGLAFNAGLACVILCGTNNGDSHSVLTCPLI